MNQGATQENGWSAAYEILTAVGPNGRIHELRSIPTTTTVAGIVSFILQESGYDAREGIAVVLYRDSRALALMSDQTLHEAGVRSGDRLQILFPAEQGGPAWLEVAKYLESQAAGGVIGGAAFGLLISTIHSVRARWRKLNTGRRLPDLEKAEAVEIAIACVCIKFNIDDPCKLVSLSAEHNQNANEWTILLRSNVIERFGGMEVRVKVSTTDPEQAQILIVPSSLIK